MCKILCKPVLNVAFNETMSFETQRMSSETSVSWQSRWLVRDCSFEIREGGGAGQFETCCV